MGNKKDVRSLTILLACTYMVSYLTRINYGTIISAMVTQTGFTKDSLSLALTGSFITYGAGQIISGIMGDRINPKKLISYGLAVTVAMNILLPFCIFSKIINSPIVFINFLNGDSIFKPPFFTSHL